ncbi:NOTC2-like protein [Mya arenaria]|uniref:NOTC2-like protein n=1 Tax=Mya arenaria TaxID=6604 RepID=A0ABY7F7H5_MYAAR|nr:NOTC2-like protein [Mya arenaria]
MLGRVFTVFTVVFTLTHRKVEGQPDFFRPDSPSDLSESITEDLSAGTSIYNIFATGGSGPLTYSIQTQSPATPAFTLQPTTSSADLYTPSGTALDRETVDAFEFVFSVTDGTDTVSSETFTVNILDVNDNAPQFENTSYTVSVFETVANGYSILTVSASDADQTATLKYYIKAGNGGNTFGLGQASGELTVTTSSNLNASTTPSYALRVEVQDNFGTNTGTATINISVIDDLCDPNPCQNSGTCALDTTSYNCTCTSGWSGINCDTDDPCFPQPCLNSGTCSISGTNYTCDCMSGYLGDTCNIVDPCEPSPCVNGATCARNSADYTCTCTSGWLGTNCSTDDPCEPQPCMNGGTCSVSGTDYTCSCPPGWINETCNLVDPCDPQPCLNGATCIDSGTNYRCNCSVGWIGEMCNIDDPCTPQPCLNSGTCRISGTIYTCDCMSGYLGDRCNIVDPCEPSPCANGATCARNSADYTCTCTSGWLGTNCSTVVIPFVIVSTAAAIAIVIYKLHASHIPCLGTNHRVSIVPEKGKSITSLQMDAKTATETNAGVNTDT